jgi:hypothetical protein
MGLGGSHDIHETHRKAPVEARRSNITAAISNDDPAVVKSTHALHKFA